MDGPGGGGRCGPCPGGGQPGVDPLDPFRHVARVRPGGEGRAERGWLPGGRRRAGPRGHHHCGCLPAGRPCLAAGRGGLRGLGPGAT
eukprot:10311000-Alexandrium_andersonii.AAC.1